jgi:DNA-binding beta-propeller fold protein YncE/cytochrome c553
MFPRYSIGLSLAIMLALPACVGQVGSFGGDDEPGDPGVTDPPPPDPPLPTPAIYTRGSLTPLFELTPRAEYGRLEHNGINMADADFSAGAAVVTSAAQKLDELSAQLAGERALPVPVQLIKSVEDRQRAQQIPFRGNPSDAKIVRVAGRTKLYVPLGGDLSTPGNEVAVIDLDAGSVITRVKVGVRPQRLAVHPSGLVFVCNQYSNYISVIDARTDQLLRDAEGPVEIATEYYCADLAFVPRSRVAPDEDLQDLYVANPWRASVLRYGLQVDRDALANRPVDVRVIEPATPTPANQPAAEITGVGSNPFRLSASEDLRNIYVANNRGGELARISVGEDRAAARIALNAPAIDVVNIGDSLLVPTTMPDRGLLASDEAEVSPQVLASPAIVTGLDQQAHEAHPGALFDSTRSYNFEDIRNGLFEIDFQMQTGVRPTYFTDDISAEPNFVNQQKILAGAVPQSIARTVAGDRIFIAFGGSDLVQELRMQGGNFEVTNTGGGIFRTAERPYAMAVDEVANQLVVASWGGEVIETFDLTSRQRLRTIDLGYAQPAYPATNIERGEYLFYNADWSNNGRKSCAGCHVDELLADGIGFANGATAPTAYHQVRPNFNLMTTDSYFWNGSFANGSYASLATGAQTRTNCELVLFGFIEGPSSDPNTRIGDPNNRVTDGNDDQCRPQSGGPGRLPLNFQAALQVVAAQKVVADQVIRAETGLGRDDVARLVDFYSVAELRLPPNPLKYLAENGQLAADVSAQIEQGKQLFDQAGCANCHDPGNSRAPFTDGLEHGSGADWRELFVNTYLNDARLEPFGGIPEQMLQAISASVADAEINIHLDPIDYFVPFCFDGQSCLSFEDPLVVRGNNALETERLELLAQVNLADPDRGFIPGNVRGRPAVNTPSLRGVWWGSNYLRHGHARTINEAVLAPGHQALRPGEKGFAVDALGSFDVHGETSTLTPQQIDALVLYVSSIE